MKLDFSKIGALNGSTLSTTVLMRWDQVIEFLAACEDEDIIWSSGDKPTEFNPIDHENSGRQWFAICLWATKNYAHAVAMTYAAYDFEPAVFSSSWISLTDIILPEEEHENLTFEEWML